jgi:hypothetical protein
LRLQSNQPQRSHLHPPFAWDWPRPSPDPQSARNQLHVCESVPQRRTFCVHLVDGAQPHPFGAARACGATATQRLNRPPHVTQLHQPPLPASAMAGARLHVWRGLPTVGIMGCV